MSARSGEGPEAKQAVRPPSVLAPVPTEPEPVEIATTERESKIVRVAPKKVDPKFLAMNRALRDRYLEQLNTFDVSGAGKYDVSRALPSRAGMSVTPLEGTSPAGMPVPRALLSEAA